MSSAAMPICDEVARRTHLGIPSHLVATLDAIALVNPPPAVDRAIAFGVGTTL
jgi:hypothetical protein